MNRFTLLPSVNWNISHMLVLNEAGTMCAYGSRGDIIIISNIHQNNLSEINSRFIYRAHKNHRVMALIFAKHLDSEQSVESVVSCGDDGYIKVWDPVTLINTRIFVMRRFNPNSKFVDLDYFSRTSTIASITEQKVIVKWDLSRNKTSLFNVDAKILMTCIAACPHEKDLVAVGARTGLVVVYSLIGEGKIRHKIRCHDSDVFCVSWCPVPYNSIALFKLREDESFIEAEFKETDRTLLLASCSKDRNIYVCRAGSNGYCETVLSLPPKPVMAISTNTNRQTHFNNSFERGRYIRWISPFVFVTFTDHNEMIFARITSKSDQKSNNRQLLSNVKLDIKPLHNVHQRSISNFVVHVMNSSEPSFRVWSCSADRMIVRCNYENHYKEKPVIFHLLSGFIFSLNISPTTLDRLAIGTGDGKICLWDLSSENTIDMTTLSRKIDNKVMSLKWHPYEEGILAFGTYEGRVGIFDVSMGSKTSSLLFKIYHHKPIYKLCWGPPIFINQGGKVSGGHILSDLYLFAVGNGDILQFNPNDLNEMPVSLSTELFSSIEEKCSCKFKTDLCYGEDRDVIVIGLSNGDVCLYDKKTYSFRHVIKEQPKSIMALAWHPKIMLDSPSEVSAFSNWLATAGENVFVYDIDPTCVASPKKIASLELHTNRILDVAWNPHINGRLLSCSADSTVIIWDVISQTVLGRYIEHCAQVLSGVWSMTNKDIAITGSADFTCRMWSVSKDTVTTLKDTKRNTERPVEPVVVNAQHTVTENGTPPPAVSMSKYKIDILLPSIGHEIHNCSMLETTVKNALNKRSLSENNSANTSSLNLNDSSTLSDSFTHAEELLVDNDQPVNSQVNDSFDILGSKGQNISLTGQCNGNSIGVDKKTYTDHERTKKKQSGKSVDLECNYSKMFGTEDEFLSLVNNEERVLENTGSNNVFVLIQARYDLKTKITEAIKKNQVTEHMLALASSISPKLWKDACEVYVEQLIQTDQIMQATNFLLALNKNEEAINLLCDKNRFKEAFTIARLRFDDEATVRSVLEKWIYFCFSCGLYRLGAHCYLYLNEEEKAGIMLSKSKACKDISLAAKLLKQNQPERAIELAADIFKRHLANLSMDDVQDLLNTFPEIKFVKPWYLTYRYMTKDQPNTADVTKWLMGMLSDGDNIVLKSIGDMDFEKLQNVIVDNTFNMTFDELMIYVSAQVALYLSGISNPNFKQAALRHFTRGLSHCYSYRIINSHRIQHDSAFPMLKLLQLMFPKGVKNIPKETKNYDPTLRSFQKSINAYFCDFALNWLISCEELPKSLKAFDRPRDCFHSDLERESEIRNNSNDKLEGLNLAPLFKLVKDKLTKLKKIDEVLARFIDDIMDLDTVHYLQYIVKVKQFDSGSSSCCHGTKSVENGSLNESSENFDAELSTVTVKVVREKIEKYEKHRVAAPNPYVFYCNVRNYLDTNKNVDLELFNKLDKLITEAGRKCEIIKD